MYYMIEYLKNIILEFINQLALKLSEWYSTIKKTFKHYFPEQSILVYSNKTNMFVDYYYRYQLIKFCNYMISLLDVECDKIHLVVNDQIGQRKAIIDDENITLSKAIHESNYLLNEKKNAFGLMILKFEIITKNGNKICVKETTKNYMHISKHQNTIQNILLFDNIKVDDDDIVNIKYYKKGKQYEKNTTMINIKDLHISEIFEEKS